MAPGSIRCRNFNSDGSVRDPCRFGKHCMYIHPDDPQWDLARNSNTGELRYHDFRGSRGAHGNREGPIRSKSRTRDARRSSTSASSPVDHGWGLPQRHTGQSDKPGWGSSKDSVCQPVSRSASALPDKARGTSSSNITGGNRDTGDAWGRTNNGWGTDVVDRDKEHDKDSASKGGTSVWGPSSSTSRGWERSGVARNDKGWSSGFDNGRSNVPSKSEVDKVNMARSESSTKSSSINEKNIGDRGWNTRAKPPDPRRPLPAPRPTETAELHKENSSSSTPQSETSSMAVAPLQRLTFPGRKSSSSTPTLSPTLDRKSIPLKVKTKGIDLPESLSSGASNSARPRELHLNRSRIQVNTIRYTLQAVRLQLDFDSALADVERWKRLRSSTQFNRATPLTQNIINDKRLAYGQNVKELENKLHGTIRHLADLPELATRADLVSAEADEQSLVKYTAQLRDWIGGLKTLYRASLVPETSSPASLPVTERPKHPNESVWEQIETIGQLVDDNICLIEDVLYANKDIRRDVASRITSTCDNHDAKRLSGAKDKAESLFKEAQQIGSDLEVLVAETADVLITIHENGLALENLNAEFDDCEQANQQAGQNNLVECELADYIQQLEQWKAEDIVLIEQLKQQVKSLHIKQRPSRLPFDQEELKERMKIHTSDKMTGQVNSLFLIIQEVAKDNNHTFVSEILKELEPILEVTNEVCRKAEAITSRLPIPS